MVLLGDELLARSEVVVNAEMKRGRGLAGRSSSSRELRVDLPDLLFRAVLRGAGLAWLDPCCGEGRALVEAARLLASGERRGEVPIVGVDLVAPAAPAPQHGVELGFEAVSLQSWHPDRPFDLITCVHGLH
jgi:hypothetical protein